MIRDWWSICLSLVASMDGRAQASIAYIIRQSASYVINIAILQFSKEYFFINSFLELISMFPISSSLLSSCSSKVVEILFASNFSIKLFGFFLNATLVVLKEQTLKVFHYVESITELNNCTVINGFENVAHLDSNSPSNHANDLKV